MTYRLRIETQRDESVARAALCRTVHALEGHGELALVSESSTPTSLGFELVCAPDVLDGLTHVAAVLGFEVVVSPGSERP
jgi:hypothetical protein